jgi:phosphatidylinositol alpha-mannosyltransferase
LYRAPKKLLPLNGPNTKTIVYVGRLDRRKGINYLIEAYKELLNQLPNAYLIIAGEGGQRAKLEQKIKSYNLNNVHFTGYVDEDEKRRLMGNADVFVSPAMYGESFGIVLVEAMAMGAPVIGGRNSGYVNVLNGHGQLGLVDPKSTADFAQRMLIFMTDEKVSGLLRGWGLNEVKKYDYPKIINQYEAVYKEAINIRDEQSKPSSSKENEKKQPTLVRRLLVRRHAR